MAEDGGSRAFAGSPQPVEIHHRGIWYSGELLGWRHEADGRVVARVRCVVDRLRHSAWKDLADLRLPDPANPPHRAVATPATPATPDEADATRPHVLMAALGSRPPKPARAVTPPVPQRSAAVAETPEWQRESAQPDRRRTRPESRAVELSTI